MASVRTPSRSRSRKSSRKPELIGKPRGVIHPRVQIVGPERFGIVSVDCAKARSKWMLADFYGNVFVPPTAVEHDRPALDAAVARIRHAIRQHHLGDLIVAVERTGRYHEFVLRAFQKAGLETRVVHPFTSKQFRLPRDPDCKTDDTDLAAIHRAAVNGFALLEPEWDESDRELQLLVRQRRDLVRKRSALQCQIREHLQVALPGFADCFHDLWEAPVAWTLLRHTSALDLLRKADRQELERWLGEQHVRFQQRSLDRIADWAAHAAPAGAAAARHLAVLLALHDDHLQKTREIQALEGNLAARVVRVPYLLLMSIPGINVISAAECAGEMGPIQFYPNPCAVTGRAGLCPSRYQSDEVDRPDRPLRKRSNRTLRAALMFIADNLIECNEHFRSLKTRWQLAGHDPRAIRVRVAMRFCRIAFHMVAGRQVYQHPASRERGYILQKLLAFHRLHHTPLTQVLPDLNAAVGQLPRSEYAAEAAPLKQELDAIHSRRRRDPQPLGEILPAVLARLGGPGVQSQSSGDAIPT
jgi:transposase